MNRGRKHDNVLDRFIKDIEQTVGEETRISEGSVQHPNARREWTPAVMQEQQDVDITQLLTDPYFLGEINIWPAVQDEIEQIWHMRCDFNVVLYIKGQEAKRDTFYALSYETAERKARQLWSRTIDELESEQAEYSFDVFRDRDIHTVIIETPKGTGKDFETAILIVLLVREFMIQDRREFFKPYNLDLNTTISINCMNRTEDQAKKVTFKEVLPKFNTPFFRDYFPPQIDLQSVLEDSKYYPSELRFPQGVVIFPGTGVAASGLGYTIGSTIIDECNFLAKSGSANKSIIGAETYDAAEEIYSDAHRRHFSRFSRVVHGKEVCAGMTVGISSTRTANDFTQRKKIEAEEDDGILYISSAYWERKPVSGLSGKKFYFDVGTMSIVDEVNVFQEYQKIVKKPFKVEEMDIE